MQRQCPKCGRSWDEEYEFCPRDASPLPETPEDPRLGEEVAGGYRLVELLHGEGLGLVYRARHEAGGADAACKLLQIGPLDRPTPERLAQEVLRATAPEHPALVKPFSHGLLAGFSPYLLTELLEGKDLRRRLARGRPEPAEAVSVVVAVGEAVTALHAAGIVHQDLSPSHVFLERQEQDTWAVRLLDLGIGRRLLGPGSVSAPEPSVYSSPEQARGEAEIEPASDVFSLALVLYEVLTGEHPFSAASTRGVLARIIADEPRPPSRVRPGLPSALDGLVARGLSRDPAARFPDAAALVGALRGLGRIDADSTQELRQPTEPPSEAWLAARSFVTVLLTEFVPPEAEDVTLEEGALGGDWALASEVFEEVVGGAGARVERLAGRTMLGVFRSAEGGGDEPITAVRAALGLGERLAAAEAGLHAGSAVATERLAALPSAGGGTESLGAVIGRVSDLLLRAPQTGVYIDDVTRERILGRFVMERSEDDRRAPVRVTGEKSHLDVLEVRRLFGRPVPLVGRGQEVRLCLDLFDRALRGSQAWFVTIVGPSGIGKSHLRHAVDRALEEDPRLFWAFSARGRPGRADDPLGLLAEMLRHRIGAEAGEPAETTRARLDELVGEHLGAGATDVRDALRALVAPARPTGTAQGAVGGEEEAGRVHWALGRLLEAMGRQHALRITVEDAQWADRPSLAFFEYLHDYYEGGLLCIVVARSELLERYPGLLAGRERHRRLDLPPLSRAEVRVLLEAALGTFPPALEEWIWARSQGTPQFIEVLLWTLAERRAIVARRGGWELAAPLSDDLLPPMIEGVLQARLEVLPPVVRDVALRASVFGRTFWAEGVEHLGAADVETALCDLARREIVHKLARSRVPGTDEYSFRHNVLQEVAWGMVPAEQQAGLASRAGRWLAEKLPHEPAVAARFFERAGRPEEAARALCTAARAACQRGASGQAGGEAFRALRLAAEGDDSTLLAEAAALALDVAWDAQDTYLCGRIERLLAKLPAETMSGCERVVQLWAETLRLLFLERLHEAAEAVRRVLPTLRQELGRSWQVRALIVAADVAVGTGDDAGAAAHIEAARRLAEEGDSAHERALVARGASLVAIGRGPGGETLRLARRALEAAQEAASPSLEAKARNNLAEAALFLGQHELALAEVEKALALSTRQGTCVGRDLLPVVHLKAGRIAEARRTWEEAREFLQRRGYPGRAGELYLGLAGVWIDAALGTSASLERARRYLGRSRAHPTLRQSAVLNNLFLLGKALVHERGGQPGEAREAAEAASAAYRRAGGRVEVGHLELFAILSRLRLDQGDVEGARRATEDGLALAADIAATLAGAAKAAFVGNLVELGELRARAGELGVAVPEAVSGR